MLVTDKILHQTHTDNSHVYAYSETWILCSEGTIYNEYKIKEMKIYVAIEIKYTKLILYYIKDVILVTVLH
jgi:hypothetical protein